MHIRRKNYHILLFLEYEYMLTLTELSLLMRGLKLLGSRLKVIDRDDKNLFMPLSSDCGLEAESTKAVSSW